MRSIPIALWYSTVCEKLTGKKAFCKLKVNFKFILHLGNYKKYTDTLLVALKMWENLHQNEFLAFLGVIKNTKLLCCLIGLHFQKKTNKYWKHSIKMFCMKLQNKNSRYALEGVRRTCIGQLVAETYTIITQSAYPEATETFCCWSIDHWQTCVL